MTGNKTRGIYKQVWTVANGQDMASGKYKFCRKQGHVSGDGVNRSLRRCRIDGERTYVEMSWRLDIIEQVAYRMNESTSLRPSSCD
jgi:hypothetical protein